MRGKVRIIKIDCGMWAENDKKQEKSIKMNDKSKTAWNKEERAVRVASIFPILPLDNSARISKDYGCDIIQLLAQLTSHAIPTVP